MVCGPFRCTVATLAKEALPASVRLVIFVRVPLLVGFNSKRDPDGTRHFFGGAPVGFPPGSVSHVPRRSCRLAAFGTCALGWLVFNSREHGMAQIHRANGQQTFGFGCAGSKRHIQWKMSSQPNFMGLFLVGSLDWLKSSWFLRIGPTKSYSLFARGSTANHAKQRQSRSIIVRFLSSLGRCSKGPFPVSPYPQWRGPIEQPRTPLKGP